MDKKSTPAVIQFLTTFELIEPLNPRHSLLGDRTNGVRLYSEAHEGEEILRYVDINSLYPQVNKNKTYPVGHPHILANPENQDIHSYFEIAKVKILASANLYHLLLPKTINNKLMFPLRGKCVVEQMEKPWLKRTEICTHTEQERCMIGTWCTPELQKAVELGYQVKKIYEV